MNSGQVSYKDKQIYLNMFRDFAKSRHLIKYLLAFGGFPSALGYAFAPSGRYATGLASLGPAQPSRLRR